MPALAEPNPTVCWERTPPTADDCRVCRGTGRQRVERDSYITEPCDACANELMRFQRSHRGLNTAFKTEAA